MKAYMIFVSLHVLSFDDPSPFESFQLYVFKVYVITGSQLIWGHAPPWYF